MDLGRRRRPRSGCLCRRQGPGAQGQGCRAWARLEAGPGASAFASLARRSASSARLRPEACARARVPTRTFMAVTNSTVDLVAPGGPRRHVAGHPHAAGAPVRAHAAAELRGKRAAPRRFLVQAQPRGAPCRRRHARLRARDAPKADQARHRRRARAPAEGARDDRQAVQLANRGGQVPRSGTRPRAQCRHHRRGRHRPRPRVARAPARRAREGGPRPHGARGLDPGAAATACGRG
mmetsp:Transcript_3195/g.9962  ORF Transcript_3195/g.9962 Transcript_3195/m.9962 type:complete len:236 (+) Transcript_3195:597-1304(+)